MAEFSKTYIITSEENTEANMAMLKKGIKLKSVMVMIFSIIGILFTCLFSGSVSTVICFGLVAIVFPFYANISAKRKIVNTYKEKNGDKETVKLEFLSDHIEENIYFGNSHEEIHYPYEAVFFTYETKTCFIFCINPKENVFLPKSQLSEEETTTIYRIVKQKMPYNFKLL